jgi:hypothetical protein
MSLKCVFEARSCPSIIPEMIQNCILNLPHNNPDYGHHPRRKRKNNRKTIINTNEFYRMMNSVSLKNVNIWIPKINTILSQYKKEDVMPFCLDVIFNQPLHSRAYAILLSKFPEDFVDYFFKICSETNINDVKKSIHKGCFFAHWITHKQVPLSLKDPSQDMAFSVSFIKTLYDINNDATEVSKMIKDFEDKTKEIIDKDFESLNLQTKMIAYDLLDIYKAN